MWHSNMMSTASPRIQSRKGKRFTSRSPWGRATRMAIGRTGAPVAPRIFIGAAMNWNSYTRSAASSSRFRHSMMWMPLSTNRWTWTGMRRVRHLLKRDRIGTRREHAFAAEPARARDSPGPGRAPAKCIWPDPRNSAPIRCAAARHRRAAPRRPVCSRCSGVMTKSAGNTSTPATRAISSSTPRRTIGGMVSTEYFFKPPV